MSFQCSLGFSLLSHTENDVNFISSISKASCIIAYKIKKIFIQKSLYKNKLILSYLYFVTPPLEDKSMWKRLSNHNFIPQIIILTQIKEHLSLNVNDLKSQSYTPFRCQPFHETNSHWAMLTSLNLNYILTWMPSLYYTLQALFFFFCINPLHPQHQYAYSPYCSPHIS